MEQTSYTSLLKEADALGFPRGLQVPGLAAQDNGGDC